MKVGGQKATPLPSLPLASQLPRVQLLIQRRGGAQDIHPEARAGRQAAVPTESVSAGGSASRVQCQLGLVQTLTEAKGVKDAAGHSFLFGSSVTSGKTKLKVKLDSALVPGPASN